MYLKLCLLWNGIVSYSSQAVPAVDLVDISDVVFSCADGEQACVGVVELCI